MSGRQGHANGSVTFRLACSEDDDSIRCLLRSDALPGSVALDFASEPSFFGALAVEGQSPIVMVAERIGRIVGLGVMTKRRVFIDGSPQEIGFLSRLRLDPIVRNSLALARGYQALKEYHQRTMKVPYTLTSIMDGNKRATALLPSGRACLPSYRPLTSYATILIPVHRWKKYRISKEFDVVSGGEVGAESIADALTRYGSQKQFFPHYHKDDFGRSDGILKGLSIDDFLVLRKGSDILGVMALWDQSSFRQVVLTGYSMGLQFLYIVGRPIFRLLGFPPLPKVGAAVNFAMAACIALKGNDPQLFSVLLQHAFTRLQRKGTDFLAVGLAENDPLLNGVGSFFHLTLPSRIYRVDWDKQDAESFAAGRVCYFELGSL